MKNTSYLLSFGLVLCPFTTIHTKAPAPINNIIFAKTLPEKADIKSEPIKPEALSQKKQEMIKIKKQLNGTLKKNPQFQTIKRRYENTKKEINNLINQTNQLYKKNQSLLTEYSKEKAQKKVSKQLQDQINQFLKNQDKLIAQKNQKSKLLFSLKNQMQKSKEAITAKDASIKKLTQQLSETKNELHILQFKPIKK